MIPKIPFKKVRFILYIVTLTTIGWLIFNHFLNLQSQIMYYYFIEKPTKYNLERAERLSDSIYKSFETEVKPLTIENIEIFIKKYDEIPFLNVNFVYKDDLGEMQSVLKEVQEIDILNAEYVYPITIQNKKIGTLLIYNINKEYAKGLEEYNNSLLLTKMLFAFLLLSITLLFILREYTSFIEERKKVAEYEAIHDGLTNLYTQTYFKSRLHQEIERCRRYKRPVSVIMSDLDYFKKFNDTYGHLAGDKMLQMIASVLSNNVRSSDLVARYGGEEFAIILVEAGYEQAKTVANRIKGLLKRSLEVADIIKDEIEKTKIDIDGKRVGVTISLGVTSYSGGANYKLETMIGEADLALYESKDHGRNTITLYNAETKKFEYYT